ncbi:LysR family transcriptional regulator [Bradyrhizobium tropiciagri]|uniref:LysR family transcriptional regulator n=1 Tax=Bradyrhizobium tropiciagri TaxID=312253 RepID=UPI001BA5AF92|nr:LysR family transcriptional regulator [Bradyrhizobium tropiciagri]MBR0895441.1 LysR family transcriptional regulator [Bradyrhizobium tropiciagri]
MDHIKLHDLRCFDAVATKGSFQAAGTALNRSHPSVFAAVARLEQQLGLTLFDRSGYRVGLTDAGRTFHERARLTLREFDLLQTYAEQLVSGEEVALRVVIGDLCPRPPVLQMLSGFFAKYPNTRLHLEYEAVGGPLERLIEGGADLVFHRADPSDPRFDQIKLSTTAMVPVVAPGFLPFAWTKKITPEQMRPFTQCVIRDTARRSSSENFFLIDGAHQCTVPDQAMKKELILHRLAWGHLPEWLIEDELRDGTLISIAGANFPGREEDLAAVRHRQHAHGPVAEALWLHLEGWRLNRSAGRGRKRLRAKRGR